MNGKKVGRLIGLDIMKIICALLIFSRHAIRSWGVSFSIFSDSICGITSTVMTCFFMMSGFGLALNYEFEELTRAKLVNFYKKRWITIMPPLFFFLLIYAILNIDLWRDIIRLLPVDILGIQSMFSSLFGITIHGGSWFVGCLLLGYLIFPIWSLLLSKNSLSKTILLLCGIWMLIWYVNHINAFYQMATLYDNAFFRCFEFLYGVELGRACKKVNRNSLAISVPLVLLGGAVVFFAKVYGNCIYSMLPLSLIFIGVYLLENRKRGYRKSHVFLEKCCDVLEKVIHYSSGLSYNFFLTQLFLWKLCNLIIAIFDMKLSNLGRILLAGLVAILLSILEKESIDRFIRNKLKNKKQKED